MSDDFEDGWTAGFDAGMSEGYWEGERQLRDALRDDLALADMFRQILAQADVTIEGGPHSGGYYLDVEGHIAIEHSEVKVLVRVLNDDA